MPEYNIKQHLMIYAGEKLFDVALQYPARLSPVSAHLPSVSCESRYSPMSTLTDPARIRVMDEGRLKDWIEVLDDCMMQYPIANRCFMDVPHFGVLNKERRVARVLVGSVGQ